MQLRGCGTALITPFKQDGSIDEAVQAMKDGAHDFLQKPVDSNHLLLLVERADPLVRFQLAAGLVELTQQ